MLLLTVRSQNYGQKRKFISLHSQFGMRAVLKNQKFQKKDLSKLTTLNDLPRLICQMMCRVKYELWAPVVAIYDCLSKYLQDRIFSLFWAKGIARENLIIDYRPTILISSTYNLCGWYCEACKLWQGWRSFPLSSTVLAKAKQFVDTSSNNQIFRLKNSVIKG